MGCIVKYTGKSERLTWASNKTIRNSGIADATISLPKMPTIWTFMQVLGYLKS